MAAPATPMNLYVQQGNGKVALSWDISAGATSYPVLRSLDGVTFTQVAAPTVNQYLDTTVVPGTQYFYQIQAANSSGASPVTTAQSVVPVLAGQDTLGQLRLAAQERADRVGSNFVTLPEWNSYINQAAFELYDLLVTLFEDYYVAEPYQFNTNASSTGQYTLPSDVYKVLGVDMLGGGVWLSLRRFQFADRNKFAYQNQTGPLAGILGYQYRVMGNKVMLTPIPATGQTLRVWYVPRMTRLLLDTDVLDSVSGWSEYVIVRAAKFALDKEESDSSVLTQELAYLKQRIEESGANRDAGMPDTVGDVKRSSGFNDPYDGAF